MAITERNVGGVIMFNETTAAASLTTTLTAPPAGMVHKILWLVFHSVAATIADYQVQKNDGTLLVRGGGVGTNILGQPHVFGGGAPNPTQGLTCVAADATKIVLTTTSGTTVGIYGAYANVPA